MAQTVLPKTESLQAGECFSDPESKNYLKSILDRMSRYPVLISDIGLEKIESLNDTESTNYYFCQLICKDQNHQMGRVWVTLSDNPVHFNFMDGFLCPQVRIEGSRVISQTFFAYNSNFSEVHNWLKKRNFRMSPEAWELQWQKASESLLLVHRNFVNTKAPSFIEAGARLYEIANQSDSGKLFLGQYLSQLNSRNWVLTSTPGSVDSIVESYIYSLLRFVNYNPELLVSPSIQQIQ